MQKRNTSGLRPWKPGESGNPGGRPREIGKAVGLVPREEFEEIVTALFWGTLDEVRKIASSPTRPALQVLIANALLGDFKRMDFKNLDRLLDRVIGGPKQVIEHWLVCPRCDKSARLERALPGAEKCRGGVA